MALIAQEATYRGTVLDGGLSESSGGYPQEVLKLKATEVYDSESQQWLPADPENNEITWYGVLFDSKNKETLNSKQVKKVTGWAGASFQELDEINASIVNTPIQFRVEPHTYQENTTLQVTWIDLFDAVPGRTVQKLDKTGVAALQQRYATILAATKTPAKAVSAPATSAPAVPAPTTATYTPTGATAVPPKPRGRPKGKLVVPGAAPTGKPVGKCTPDEAWDTVMILKRDDISEEKMTEIWSAEAYKMGDDPDKFSPETWFKIKTAVQKQTSKV